MNNKQTYLVVTPFFPSQFSHVGNYVFDQVAEIKRQTKYKIQIVKVCSLFSTEVDYTYNGFDVYIFKIIDFPFFIFPGIFNFANKIRFKRFLIQKSINNLKIAHAHVNYPSSFLISDLKCKTISQHHGLDVIQLLNGRSSIIRKIQKSFQIHQSFKHLNKIHLNIGVSKKVVDNLMSFSQSKIKRTYVLYNGVDTKIFYPINKKRNDVFTIGCVGNFWKIKGQDTLIKSVQILKKKGVRVMVRFIGIGDNLLNCQKYVIKHDLIEDIKFEDEMNHNELNKFYNEIDLFVLPSYYEAFGCVYLESWATETPYIAVKDQGISEITPEPLKDIILINPSDPEDLSEKISYIYKNRVEMRFDSKYDIQNTISDFLKDNFLQIR